ncbi:hypothetical protein RSOLAG22IIIB_11034 [Rhizoctonia solani]|uniref:Ubiquitin-like domain-containing protein n=1 Tax=Rhizoctonia solani TaxID=456999 RepID=A0A0K6G6E5_9AGAM|nr:hypothetical protein RSOLAG22IIIB_11034 [Rhizoctonia solani]
MRSRWMSRIPVNKEGMPTKDTQDPQNPHASQASQGPQDPQQPPDEELEELSGDKTVGEYGITEGTVLYWRYGKLYRLRKSEREMVDIIVKTLRGRNISISVELSWTVEKLKEKIHELEGTDVEVQRLIVDGKQLEDGRTLEDYKIREGGPIVVVERSNLTAYSLRGGGSGEGEVEGGSKDSDNAN